MKKKLLLLLFAGLTMMSLTACSQSDAKKYAIIENNTSEEEKDCVAHALTGMQKYASEAGEQVGVYQPEGEKRKDYAKAIEQAVEEGAEVVVCVGDELSVPVYEAQNDYRRVNFILLNAEPHKRYSDKANIAENTISLHFDDKNESFLAGYVAVAHGSTDIGVMGGAKEESDLAKASAFVQGAETAAKDLGLAPGSITLRYTFTGENKLSPAYMGQAMDWYNEGCEVIFASNEKIRASVIQAAQSVQKHVIGLGEESMEESDCMLTAGYANYGGAVYHQLELLEEDVFEGAQSLICGAKEEGTAVVIENSGLSEGTASHYTSILVQMSGGQIKINTKVKIPNTEYVTIVEY